MKISHVYRTSALLLAGVVILSQSSALYGFVVSCEKELAQFYPPALKGDLSACAQTKPVIKPTAAADLTKFTRRLNGTWELKMRTVQGLASDVNQLSAKLYFDLAGEPGGTVTGAALMLESSKTEGLIKASATKPTALGFWDVSASQRGKLSLSLDMTASDRNRYAPAGIRDVKGEVFSELDNVFVSAGKSAPSSVAWDRVILGDNVLIYVSCSQGLIERYAKVSGQKPAINGLGVKAYWQALKDQHLMALSNGPARAR